MLTVDETFRRLTEIGTETLNQLTGPGRAGFNPLVLANARLPEDFLKSFPFGHYLSESAHEDPARIHLLYVIAGATDAFIDGGRRLTNNNANFNLFHANINNLAQADRFPQMELSRLCMCAALYHDLGKAIAPERHPYEGYHLVHDLGNVPRAPNCRDTDTTDFMRWLSADNPAMEKEDYRFFSKIIRYHDLWGNVTTGETSLVMVSSTLDPTERCTEAQLIFLGHLLLLNLADMFGSAGMYGRNQDNRPNRIPEVVLAHLLRFWKEIQEVLQACRNVAEARERLIEDAGEEGNTVERIVAMLKAMGLDVTSGDVHPIMRAEFGGRLNAFCQDFAVMQLSYALSFFRELIKVAKKSQTPEKQSAAIVIKVLRRIADTYESLIRANREQGRGTGIEMFWLSRNPKVKEKIIQSLLGQSPEALVWIDDEISAFPCG